MGSVFYLFSYSFLYLHIFDGLLGVYNGLEHLRKAITYWGTDLCQNHQHAIGMWCVCVCVCALSCVQLFMTPWTACQVPLSIEFSRQEYWNGLPFLPLGDFHNPGIELASPVSASRFFITRVLLAGQECICQCRRHRRVRFYPWVGKIQWRRQWQLTPGNTSGKYFLAEKSHGQRSLVGYSSKGRKESATTAIKHSMLLVSINFKNWDDPKTCFHSHRAVLFPT